MSFSFYGNRYVLLVKSSCMASIVLEGLTVKFETKGGKIVTALDHVDTTFPHGAFSVVLGNSGGGKTTLLRSIIGSVLINGKILINGVDNEKLSIQEKNISYVSQEFSLYPHMSVYENIAFPLSAIGAGQDEIKSRVFDMANKLGISDLLNRQPKQLSIGQKQRVALARALIKRSDIYLFDEPFSNVDKAKSDQIKPLLKKVLSEMDATVIYVTHEVEDVYLLSDRVYIIENGKLIYDGSLDKLREDKSDVLAPYHRVDERMEWQ